MGVRLSEILENNIFDGSTILAGKAGIYRQVRRVSVFDCPCHADILSSGIMEPGDIFITCLEQFEDGDETLQPFFDCLVQYESAGLLVVSTGRVNVLNQSVLDFCDEHNFPVVFIKADLPYAKIMGVINKYLTVEMMNTINRMTIERIRLGGLTDTQTQDAIHSINPRLRENIRAIYVSGTFHSNLFTSDMWAHYMDQTHDTLIMGDPLVILLSSDDVKSLKQRTNHVASEMNQYFSDFYLGFSRIHPLREIRQVLMEGDRALKIATALNVTQQEYNPLSSLQMLLSIQGSQEERDFYDAYVKAIAGSVSADALGDFLQTIEAFVTNAGDYKKTAQQIQQHENTIRYRVNRIKQVLGMEGDPIRFYETISLAVQLRIILGEKFPGTADQK